MGYAVGVVGMRLDDFCRLSPEEFSSVSEAFSHNQEQHVEDSWERMRLLAAITIQPHCKNRIRKEQLVPLPWDRKNKDNQFSQSSQNSRLSQRAYHGDDLTIEQRLARAKKRVEMEKEREI